MGDETSQGQGCHVLYSNMSMFACC